MNITKISSNIYVNEELEFGIYNKNIVYRLLQQVQLDFSNWIGEQVFQTCDCFISYKNECPETYKREKDSHLICLNVKEDNWWQWVYQFSHEYCHHLINGNLNGDLSGLKWFEETVCNLASKCHLSRLVALCDVLLINNQYKDIAFAHYVSNAGSPQRNCQEYLKQSMDELSQSEYHREIYSNLAASMLPLFQENHHLWKMILHFGDMCSWHSLEDLFEHLQKTADDSYSVSLDKLYKLLL